MEKKSQKIYLTHYSLLIAQNLSQADYEFLSVNFVEEFIKLNVNTGTIIKKCETCGIKYKVWDCSLEYINFNYDYVYEHKCLWCNKNYQQTFHRKFKKRFLNTYKFSNNDNHKFINIDNHF